MEPLSPFQSKKLFFKRIFGSENCCPDMLKEVSDEILKKCGGLPLAIVSISSLLANTPVDKQEWEKVKRSIGSDLGKNQSLERINIILSLSYNVLSPNLKTCLLYLSNFPEDCVIDRERLVRRWIAEGFIPEERGQSRQDVAEKYFYELINKSMIQPVDIGYNGKARACRVHDMMAELIISKSSTQNFVTVVGGEQTVLTNHRGFIRRLSVQHIDLELASVLANEDLGHVRSLTSTSGCIRHLPSLVKFKALRTLDFEGCQDLNEYDMNGIEKLFQLKYLSFKDTWISKLSSRVAMLHDLETLDLRNTCITELPAEIVQLSKLQHLLTARGKYRERHRSGKTKIPNGIKNMRNLQVISGFNITMSSVGAVEELGNLNTLNELHIHLDDGNEGHEDMLLSSLCKLATCKLQCLWISSNYYSSPPLWFLDSWSTPPPSLQKFGMTTNYYFPRIPKWITPSLTSLSYLLILLTKVTQGDIHILGNLPALLYLELWFEERQTERLAVQGRGFRCLKEFHFRRTRDIGGPEGYIVFEQGALPKVEKMRLSFFLSMAEPYKYWLGIIHLPCLRVLEVDLCQKGCTFYEIADAEKALKNEASTHPKLPRVTIFLYS
jgi:disease resistance protein RPM1